MADPDLFKLMKEPALLNEETLPVLKKLAEQHPYASTYSLLYLKNLATIASPELEQEVKRLAIALPDRRRLFLLIEGERYGLKLVPLPEKETTKEDSFSLIDSFLSDCREEQPKTEESPLLFQPSTSADYLSWATTDKPAEAPQEATEHPAEPEPKLQHQELIDSFLQEEKERNNTPRRPLPQEETEAQTPESIQELEESQRKASLDDSYFTETLARIYVKQKRYDKALQIIKKLSLKYPEKNIYFADQIRFLEKLIINTKK